MATYEEAVQAAQELQVTLAPYPAQLAKLNTITEWGSSARSKLVKAAMVRDKILAFLQRYNIDGSVPLDDIRATDLLSTVEQFSEADIEGNPVAIDAEIKTALDHFAETHPGLASTLRTYIESLGG